MLTPDTTCANIRPLLSSFVDREIDPEEATLVREHLGTCSACASHIAFLRALGSALDSAPLERPSPLLYERIARATYARPTLRERVSEWFAPAPVRLAVGTGLAASIVAALVLPRLAEIPAANVGGAHTPTISVQDVADSVAEVNKGDGKQPMSGPLPAVSAGKRVAPANLIARVPTLRTDAAVGRVAVRPPAPSPRHSSPTLASKLAAASVTRSDVRPLITSAKPSDGSGAVGKAPTRHIALNATRAARTTRIVSLDRPTVPAPAPVATPASMIADTSITPERAPRTPAPTPEAPRPEVPISVPEAATRVAVANDPAEASAHAIEPVRSRSSFRATFANLGVGRRTGSDLNDLVDNSKAKLAVGGLASIVGSRGTSGF
jgi:hypothetical protein